MTTPTIPQRSPPQSKQRGKGGRVGWLRFSSPHRYSRTELLFEEFSRSFQEADVVILTDIYAPPPEEPVAGINSANLAERIRYHQHGKPVYHIGDQREVAPFLAQWLSQEDLVLVMGAGPIWRVARQLLQEE